MTKCEDDFQLIQRTNKRAMAAGAKRSKAKWDSDAERKIIDIWADILEEYDGKMLTRKKKEAIATIRLNVYMTEELNKTEQYTEKAVCNKIDSIMKKGKQMYVTYQKKGETGKEYTQEEVDMDMEAAELAWPNFKTFFTRFKDHPSLGPGAVDDSAATVPSVATEVVVPNEEEDEEGATRCPSRASNRSTTVGGSDDDDDEEDDEVTNPPKKSKGEETSLVARIGKKKGKQMGATQFLVAFGEMQENAQMRQMEHERKMQQEAIAFQQKMEQDRIKFEVELSTTLQQQSSQFQVNLMQQSQAFQAELLKKLFEKKDS